MVDFTGERIVPGAENCEPQFAKKMYLEHLTRYQFASQWVRGKCVLDVGCGVGYGSRWLAEHGAESVVAIDLSVEAIEHARTHYAHERVEYVVASATDFNFGGDFDVVTCFELIEHVDDQSAVIQCIQRALKADGTLVMSTPRALEQKRTHYHTKEFSEREFISLLRLGFPNVTFFFQNNHFSSLIGSKKPTCVERVLAINDQFTLAQADYFIAVATASLERIIEDECDAVMSLGDDKYVTLLERDVGILHDAEDRLKLEVDAIRHDLSGRVQDAENLRSDLDRTEVARGRSEVLLSVRDAELLRIRSDIEERLQAIALRESVISEKERSYDAAREERERLLAIVEARISELVVRQGELEELRANVQADAERAHGELLIAESRWKECDKELVEQKSQIEGLKTQIDGLVGDLTHSLSRVAERDAAITELNAEAQLVREEMVACDKRLTERDRELDRQRETALYLDRTIEALTNSRSWRMTAVYRRAGTMMLRLRDRLTRRSGLLQPEDGYWPVQRKVNLKMPSLSKPASGPHISEIPVGDAETAHHFDVIFAIGCWEGESKRYRVFNLAEALERKGLNVQVMPFEKIATLSDDGVVASVVVLFRAPFDPRMRVDVFLNYAKQRSIKVVFDVDDLVFEPEIVDQIDGFRLLSEQEQQQYIEGVHQYRRLLLAADLVTVPTEYLRERVARLSKPAEVIVNSINDVQQGVADELLAKPPRNDGLVRIGYFSGSRTHQADFAQCADALFEVMSEHPEVVFRLVGYLNLEPRWEQFAARTERVEFQPYQQMLHVLSECDINIAPLNLDSIFCHGKSELKYFEAALLRVPTAASATDTYVRAIQDGVNGFLLHADSDWKDVLSRLVSSPELRKAVGFKARQSALEHYAVQVVAETARRIYGLAASCDAGSAATELFDARRTGTQSSPLRISWVIPELIIGGGGHRNILRAAYHLSQFGHHITLYFTGNERRADVIKQQIRDHFYPLECPVHVFEGRIGPADVVFATHWTTVDAALTSRGQVKEIMYFVQDFEPAFAPMGSEYVLAENTYRLGLYHITSGPWCETMLRRDFGATADHFRFPVDRVIYHPRERTKQNKNLIFFAKPEMPRRCFELGMLALREFHRLRSDVEIILFGSKHVRKHSYDFPVTIRDVLPTLDDLAEMYSNGDLGLVFSTTNPSLIPYEMMACGLPVVDLDRGDNAVNYGARRDIALLANPLPLRMAVQMADLIGNAEELATRSASGLAFIDEFPSEIGMARRIESLIFTRWAKTASGN